MAEVTTGIEVRYFAAAADAAGREKDTIDLPEGADLGALRAVLVDRYGAGMERVLSVAAFLLEPGDGGTGELTRDLSRPAGSRVDVLPPFAGG
ncbi:MoaD/ThiS family protein [Rhodococcus pyridinivorans]|uniref:MoaD/ThiS family protein n=1 Tax=Rhodococcus pyridinivorans TaxID=103816 RepID=UPI0002F3FB39|nr:molybdenum cofactor biosynthesis protein MoaD [Rhodococcus pyridinivorans]